MANEDESLPRNAEYCSIDERIVMASLRGCGHSPPTMLVLLALVSLGTLAVAVTIHAVLTAPIGYEDESGFHPEICAPGSVRSHEATNGVRPSDFALE